MENPNLYMGVPCLKPRFSSTISEPFTCDHRYRDQLRTIALRQVPVEMEKILHQLKSKPLGTRGTAGTLGTVEIFTSQYYEDLSNSGNMGRLWKAHGTTYKITVQVVVTIEILLPKTGISHCSTCDKI